MVDYLEVELEPQQFQSVEDNFEINHWKKEEYIGSEGGCLCV